MKRLKIERGVSEIGSCGGSSSNQDKDVSSYFDFEKHRASFILKKGEIWAVRNAIGMPDRYVLVEKDGDIHSASVRFLKHYYGGGVWGGFESDNTEPLDKPEYCYKVVGWEHYRYYYILPRKGEVWAIRTDNTTTLFGCSFHTLIKYQMVEVVESYIPYKGMKIAYLDRVRGRFDQCFRRGQTALHVRPKFVLERLSHQVPYVKVLGEESLDGCLQLDPSSLPLYIDGPESAEPEINDSYLFLCYLDRNAYRYSAYLGGSSIWAVYDHQSRVPLKYVELHSKGYHPNKKLIMHELIPFLRYEHEKKWHEAGLPIASGNFMISPVETEKQLTLSHDIRCWHRDSYKVKIGSLYYINIYPNKGEVWGIYKFLDMPLDHNAKQELEYQIVTIVEKTDKDVKVQYLVRVKGFKGLFRKKSDHESEVDFQIPVHEFYRFSHQIPCYAFDENCSEFLREAFVLDPFLVPQKLGECFSFSDPFLWDRSKASPSWSAIQYIVNQLRNGAIPDGGDHGHEQLENCILNSPTEQEETIDESLHQREPNLGEISVPTVHENEHMELEAAEHDAIHLRFNIKYYDFDDPKNFELGEVWAVFDGLNVLPHSYARIDQYPNSEGMLEVTLLEPHPVTDEEMQWVEENLSMACGTFKASRSTCIQDITFFSHRVIYANEQPSRLFFKVYPRKGEVWAIYKHWTIKCAEMKNNVEYKLVEVVSDFTEEAGVMVVALARAEGHENVFRRCLHEGFWLFTIFKRKEMLRFSHCIPSLKLTGGQDGSIREESFRIKFSHNGL